MLVLNNFKPLGTEGRGFDAVQIAEVDVTTGTLWWKRTERRVIRKPWAQAWHFAGTGEFTPGVQAETLARAAPAVTAALPVATEGADMRFTKITDALPDDCRVVLLRYVGRTVSHYGAYCTAYYHHMDKTWYAAGPVIGDRRFRDSTMPVDWTYLDVPNVFEDLK